MKGYHLTIWLGCLLSNSLYSEEIVIQPDYWTGTACLDNGTPWQVPESIYKEDENCRSDDMVLEFGSGGSTVFFARRCKYVVSIETDPTWASVVRAHLKKLGLTNVTILHMDKQSDIENFIRNFDTKDINILSVDTVHGYNRSAFLDLFLEKGITPNLHMIVLDNYASPSLFQSHYNREAVDLEDWLVFNYDDDRWHGNGTKLYIRKYTQDDPKFGS